MVSIARSLMSKEDTGYEFSFSMFLPADFPIVPTRLVIAQWKQSCAESIDRLLNGNSPVLAIRYVSGELPHHAGARAATAPSSFAAAR